MTRGRIPIITDYKSTDLIHIKANPYGGNPWSVATPVSNFFGKSRHTITVAASDTLNAAGRADYVCDGTDDHLTIQEAIDALPADGGRVHLLEGTFVCGGQIILPHDTSLIGSGKSTLIQFDVVQDIGITNKVGSTWRITVAHMKIDGMDKTNDLIEFANATRCEFHHLDLTRGVHDGLELGVLCRNNIISNVIAHNSVLWSGIEIDDGSYNNIVSNCTVYDCNDGGIVIGGTSYQNTIVGCIAINNGGEGIRMTGATADNVAVGNLTYGNAGGHVLDSGTNNTVIAYADGNMGLGVAAPAGKYHIDQAVDDAAIPALVLDQADVSEGFINFIGSDRGVIGEGTNSTKSIRVELGGVVYRLALYADA